MGMPTRLCAACGKILEWSGSCHLDKNMPGLSGLDLLPGLRTICPDTPVIMITAFGDVATYVDAMEKGAFEYVFKPFRMEELLRVLGRALTSRSRPATWAFPAGVKR